MDLLNTLLEHNMVEVISSVWNWQDAVKRGSQLLIKNGFATKDYTNAILENTKKNGPYYALLPHVVMPHARPEQGGIKSGVSLLIIKNGVDFNSESDPVHLVFTVAAGSSDDFSEQIMPSIANLLENTKGIEELITAQNSSDAKKMLKEWTTQPENTSNISSSNVNNEVSFTKSMHILTVCGVGMGSSLVLRMNVEGVLKEMGISSIKVEHADVSSASSMKTDLIITAKEFAEVLKTKVNTPIIVINNYADKEGVRALLTEKLNQLK